MFRFLVMLFDREAQRVLEHRARLGRATELQPEFAEEDARHHPVGFLRDADLEMRPRLRLPAFGDEGLREAETEKFVVGMARDERGEMVGAGGHVRPAIEGDESSKVERALWSMFDGGFFAICALTTCAESKVITLPFIALYSPTGVAGPDDYSVSLGLFPMANVHLSAYPGFHWSWCLVGALFGFAPWSTSAAPDALDALEQPAGEWLKVRTETVRLEAEWATERPLLESTVAGLTERATVLEEKREQARVRTAKDREELASLEARNRTAAEDAAYVEARLQTLTAQLAELRPQLPPRLASALEMSFRSLAGKELGAGERMQLITTMLNRCAQFNRIVSCGEEVLTFDPAQGARSVSVIYWGLSHGYALDEQAGMAWLGTPGAGGWKWRPQPEARSRVAALIAIYNDKADPALVAVPVRLTHPAGPR